MAAPDRLFIVWAIVVVIFFSISKSKLPAYILTASVALAVLSARLFVAALAHEKGAAARLIFRGLSYFIFFSAVVCGLLSLEIFTPGTFAKWGLHSSELQRIALLFMPAIQVLVFLIVLAAVALWRRKVWMAFATFLLLPLLLLTTEFSSLLQYSASSTRQIAAAIPPLPADTPIVCYECFRFSLPRSAISPSSVVTAASSPAIT